MSVNDVTRNSPGEMEQHNNLPESPPKNSSSSDAGPSICGIRDRATEQTFGGIFTITQPQNGYPDGHQTYYKDDRNMLEYFFELLEMSVLQLMIWIVVFAFSITYIIYGLMNDGKCTVTNYDTTGKVSGKEDDVDVFMTIEGGVLFFTAFFEFSVLLYACQKKPSTHQKAKIDLEEQKRFDRLLFGSQLVFYLINICLCIAGGIKIFTVHNQEKDTKSNCDSKFSDFYFKAKVVQFVVMLLYHVYFVLSCSLILLREKWFLRRKLRCWANFLDADRDGVISQDDMKKTNEKLEKLRISFGVRQRPLPASDQKEWWNENIFKQEAGRLIKVEDYVLSVENYLGKGAAYDRANRIRPVVKKWFHFFTTEENINGNFIMTENDFVKFWTELSGNDEQHYKRMFIKHFPSPFTMSDFVEDFVAFLSNPEYSNEFSNRVFKVVKYRSGGVCLKS